MGEEKSGEIRVVRFIMNLFTSNAFMEEVVGVVILVGLRDYLKNQFILI